MVLEIDELLDGLSAYFDEEGYHDLDIEINNSTDSIEISLDLPSTSNYDSTMKCLERFFNSKSSYHIEDFDIDGDYEGQITVSYIGE